MNEANVLLERTLDNVDEFVLKSKKGKLDEALFYSIINEMHIINEFLGRMMGAIPFFS